MPRRSNGEGNIFLRSDGRWQARLQLNGKRISLYGSTRAEVVEKLRRQTQAATQNGQLPENPKMCLVEFIEQWLEAAEERLRPTTIADYKVLANKHIVPHIGSTRLSKLTPFQLARLYTALAKQGLSSRRLRMVHDFLRKLLGDAHKWGMLANNPAALVDAPKREQKERTLWSPDQAQTFITAMQAGQGGHYGDLFLFLLASGCRLGEALSLRWSDIDWRQGTVKIERQVCQVGQRFIEQSPKTRAGIRTVALPSFGLEALKRTRERAKGVRAFTSEAGTTPLRSNVRRALHQACDRLNLPKLRPHDLRHLSLSLLAMNGVPVKVAQQRAGHSSAQVTLNVYQHVLGDGDRLAAEALDGMLRKAGRCDL